MARGSVKPVYISVLDPDVTVSLYTTHVTVQYLGKGQLCFRAAWQLHLGGGGASASVLRIFPLWRATLAPKFFNVLYGSLIEFRFIIEWRELFLGKFLMMLRNSLTMLVPTFKDNGGLKYVTLLALFLHLPGSLVGLMAENSRL